MGRRRCWPLGCKRIGWGSAPKTPTAVQENDNRNQTLNIRLYGHIQSKENPMDFLPDRLPWFIAGPSIGLLVVALYAVANKHFGVSGSYMQVMTFVRSPRMAEMWRVWFFGGLVAGSLVAAFLRGGPSPNLAYGVLADLLPIAVIVPVLFVGGLLMGFGARWGGGCTSGHGITGAAILSRGAWVGIATIMATAIGLTLIVHLITGGAL